MMQKDAEIILEATSNAASNSALRPADTGSTATSRTSGALIMATAVRAPAKTRD